MTRSAATGRRARRQSPPPAPEAAKCADASRQPTTSEEDEHAPETRPDKRVRFAAPPPLTSGALPVPRADDTLRVLPSRFEQFARDSAREWIMALGHGPARLDAKGVRGKFDYASRVIRDQRYKVWVDESRAITQLYDLADDPWEQNNLIDSQTPAHVQAREKFQKVVDSMPARDARPKYNPRPANPWDRRP